MISLIKKIAQHNKTLYNGLKAAYNYWYPKEINIQLVLTKYDAIKQSVSFVQVGSNDGLSGDPIYSFITQGQAEWRGLLIEPVPYLYEKLKTNYLKQKNRLIFENVAIDHQRGSKTLYRIAGISALSETPWYEQIGSFSKTLVEKQKQHIENFDNRLIEEQVVTTTFNGLMERHNIQKIDVIHIDTEGYDFEVIKLIDWERFTPDILLFEHKHLSRLAYKSCCRLLRRIQFKLFVYEGDTLAVQSKIIPSVIG